MGFLDFLYYLRIKFVVSSLRLLLRLFGALPSFEPDSLLEIPSRDKGRIIKVHVYNLAGDAGAQPLQPRPVLINFFGGGFTMPMHGSDDRFCRQVVTQTSHVVLDVQYRLAPEFPFPAAVNDAEDVAKHVLEHPDVYKRSHISLSGFSSGGSLALITAGALFPHGTFAGLIGFYPSSSMAGDPGDRKAPVPGKERSPFWTRIFREAYLRGKDAQDPRISPLFGDTTNYPQEILIFTADHDVSATDMEALADRIKTEAHANGRNVLVKRMKNCDHGFDKKTKDEKQIRARQDAYALAVDLLKRLELRERAD